MTSPNPLEQREQKESQKVFLGLLLLALAAGLVLFVVAVFFGVATPG